jgi:ribosomal-protein-alanine N-acetyltransferase
VVTQWLDGEPWAAVDRAREERLKLQAGIDAGKWYFWALSESASSPLVGTLCLWGFTPDGRECEVGLELFPARQGQGLMTEAMTAVLDWAWLSLPLESISALTHRDNRPARQFLEHRGFVPGPIPPSWGATEAEVGTQAFYRLTRPQSPLARY